MKGVHIPWSPWSPVGPSIALPMGPLSPGSPTSPAETRNREIHFGMHIYSYGILIPGIVHGFVHSVKITLAVYSVGADKACPEEILLTLYNKIINMK